MSKSQITLQLPPDLLARLETAAAAEFETAESFLPMLLSRLFPRTINRDGGKKAARRLIRPIKSRTKRAAVLRFFLDSPDITVDAAAGHFHYSREAIFSHFATMNTTHGIGYHFDAASDVLTVKLPPFVGCPHLFRD